MHRLKLVMSGPSRGEIFIDGKKVEGVRGIDIRAAVDEINTVKLTLSCEAVEVDGDFIDPDVVDITAIGDETRRFRKIKWWERVERWLKQPGRDFGPA